MVCPNIKKHCSIKIKLAVAKWRTTTQFTPQPIYDYQLRDKYDIAICSAFEILAEHFMPHTTQDVSFGIICAYRVYACSRHRSALISERSVTSCIHTRYTVTWSWYVPDDWSSAWLVGRAWFLRRAPWCRGSLTAKPSITGHLINKNFHVLHVDRCPTISFAITSFCYRIVH